MRGWMPMSYVTNNGLHCTEKLHCLGHSWRHQTALNSRSQVTSPNCTKLGVIWRCSASGYMWRHPLDLIMASPPWPHYGVTPWLWRHPLDLIMTSPTWPHYDVTHLTSLWRHQNALNSGSFGSTATHSYIRCFQFKLF